jgi:hypothetical protein
MPGALGVSYEVTGGNAVCCGIAGKYRARFAVGVIGAHLAVRAADLQDASDRDEQRGFMMMFGGAAAGLRNPRAHKLIKDDPERALEFIAT